jgi:tripartite-type tricarboxylate transporter receptor subunit TctC
MATVPTRAMPYPICGDRAAMHAIEWRRDANRAGRGPGALNRRDVVLALAGLSLAPQLARAETYPARAIKIVVPFPSGGPTDVMARMVAQRLSASLGQGVFVENRPGAGGTTGSKTVAQADADGYTLLFGSTSTLAIAPALYRNLDYDPVTSFAPVAAFSNGPLVLVLNPDVPAASVQELIAMAKASPGRLNFASAGVGTPPHLTGELFKSRAGIDIVHVPYKGGAPAIQDVMGGQVQMTFEVVSVTLPLIQAGRVKALAVTGRERIPQLLDTPTMIESGLADFESYSWTGLVAPAATSAPIVTQLNEVINAALRSNETKATLHKLGVDPLPGSPEDFGRLLTTELRKWSAIAQAAGAKAEG